MNKKAVQIIILSLSLGILLTSCAGSKTAEYITFDSATLRNVTRITDNELPKGKLAVSKDGSKILYSEKNGAIWQIMLLRNINSSAKTTLVQDPSYGPSWFENGSEYLYSSIEQGQPRIVKSNIAGGGKTYIARNPVGEYDTDPVIKGNTILFSTEIQGKSHIVSMNDKGGEITILGEGMQPNWHPHKNKFVYASPKDGGIYEMDIQDNQVTQIFSVQKDQNGNLKEWCRKPSYSQDGNWILFSKGANTNISVEVKSVNPFGSISSQMGNVETKRMHLFVIKEDGSDFTQLTSGNVDVYQPVWGVGNDIFFVANVQGKDEIWRASLAFVQPVGYVPSAEQTPAPSNPASASAPVPAPAPKRDEGLL